MDAVIGDLCLESLIEFIQTQVLRFHNGFIFIHENLRERSQFGAKGQKTKNPAEAGFKIGRRERIRTSDPLVPNQLRYQAALLAEILLFEFLVQFVKVVVRGGGLEPPRP